MRPIAAEERLGWRVYMERYHYLGERPIVGEHLLYAAFLDTELVALIGWASAALHAAARERFVGWEEPARRKHLHLVANNFRFLVLPCVRVKNLASKLLGANLRRLSADWQVRWGHPVYDELFTFLDYWPLLSPYNNHAEQQTRGPVMSSRISQGNRSQSGAEAQAVLMSIFRSMELQARNPLDELLQLAQAARAAPGP